MGYQRNRTRPLEFVDDEFAGLEVVADVGSMDQYFEIDNLVERPASNAKEALKDLEEIFDKLVPLLVSWNLQDNDGNPVPLDRETFGKQDRVFTGAVIGAWLSKGVRRPLSTPSPSGEQSVAESIPMETLPDDAPKS